QQLINYYAISKRSTLSSSMKSMLFPIMQILRYRLLPNVPLTNAVRWTIEQQLQEKNIVIKCYGKNFHISSFPFASMVTHYLFHPCRCVYLYKNIYEKRCLLKAL